MSISRFPEPITRNNIQILNTQLNRIYTGKHGEPRFTPVGPMPGGGSFGTLFRKTTKKPEKVSLWIGKVGDQAKKDPACLTRVQAAATRIIALDPIELATTTNTNAILEKLSYDLYKEFGRNYFFCPKSRLSRQPVLNPFADEFARCLAEPVGTGGGGITESLRIMSEIVEGYQNLESLRCKDITGVPCPIMDYITRYKRPPEKVLNPAGEEILLNGLVALTAVARILGDPDCIGGSGTNAGYRWKENGAIEIVKIDPGECFNFFSGRIQNRAYHLYTSSGVTDPRVKDLQLGPARDGPIFLWEALTEDQKEEFISVLFNAGRYLHLREDKNDIIEYLVYRDNKFKRGDTEQFPPQMALRLEEGLKECLMAQLTIYEGELLSFKQKHLNQVLRIQYIDHLGELPLIASEGNYPVRELFTPLTLLSTVQKQEEPDRKEMEKRDASRAFLPERDTLLEAMHRMRTEAAPIECDVLFEPLTRDGNKPIKTVLMVGGAGIGKSTFCQKLAHDWASGRQWQDKYEFVFWLKLRELNARMNVHTGSLYGIHSTSRFLAMAIAETIFGNSSFVDYVEGLLDPARNNVLVILDGYDEAIDPLRRAIHPCILEKLYPLLLTSRPGSTEALHDDIDRVVEGSGFSDQHVKEYMEHYFTRGDQRQRDVQEAEQLQEGLWAAIQRDVNVRAVAHIPLQLQMLCHLWEKHGVLPHNTTLIYQNMIKQILTWQNKRNQRAVTIEQQIQLCTILGEIALEGLKTGGLLLSEEILTRGLNATHYSVRELQDTGLIQKNGTDYQFLHLTFQEHLIAYAISQKTAQEITAFIVEYRYLPKFQIVMAFLGGLIAGDDDANRTKTKEFLIDLHSSEGADLIGAYQLELTLRCLNECSDPQIEEWVERKYSIYATLIKILMRYIKGSDLPLTYRKERYFQWVVNLFQTNKIPEEQVKKTIAQLGSVLNSRFLNVYTNRHKVLEVLETFAQHASPERSREIFDVLKEACRDRESLIRGSAASTLGLLGNRIPIERWKETYSVLQGILLNDKDKHVQYMTKYAFAHLGDRIPLEPWKEIANTLREAIQEERSIGVRHALCSFYRGISRKIWREVFETLQIMLEDPNRCVRQSAIIALGDLSQGLSHEERGEIFSLLKTISRNSSAGSRQAAIFSVNKFIEGSSREMWEEIFGLLKIASRDSYSNIQLIVIEGLTALSANVSSRRWGDLFHTLRAFLDHSDGSVRKSAITALGILSRTTPLGAEDEVFEVFKRVVYSIDTCDFDTRRAFWEFSARASPEKEIKIFSLLRALVDSEGNVSLCGKAPRGKWMATFHLLRDIICHPSGQDLCLNRLRRAVNALGELIGEAPPQNWAEALNLLKTIFTQNSGYFHTDVQGEVVKALGRLGESTSTERWGDVFDILKKCLAILPRTTDYFSVRSDIATAFGSLGETAPPDRWGEVFEILIGMSKENFIHTDDCHRYHAALALGRMGQNSSLAKWKAIFDVLKEMLRDGHWFARGGAEEALAALYRRKSLFHLNAFQFDFYLKALQSDKKFIRVCAQQFAEERRALHIRPHTDPSKSHLCMVDNNQEMTVLISSEAVRLVCRVAHESPLHTYVKRYAQSEEMAACVVQ